MNKRKEGYIYIFTIILISLLALFFYFIYSYTSNTSYISLNKVEKIQANYAAESVLNIKSSEENFNKDLEKLINSHSIYNNLACGFKPNDTEIKRLQLRMLDDDKSMKNFDLVELSTDIKYKNSLSSAKIRANYINKLYKMDDGVLNSGKVNKDDLEKIKNSFEKNNWTHAKYKLINLDGDFIYGDEKGKKYIFEEVEEINENTLEKTIKRIPRISLDNVNIIVQNSGSLKIESDINNQILVINDKVLFNHNRISGIIILNNNAQISNNCKLVGYLIDLYDKNSSISVKYNPPVLKFYGSVMPDFIKFQPISLNHYDLEDNT